MTHNPYARIVLDASALAARDLSFELQAKVLRTAVHVGVRWLFCPTEKAQSLAGRALFDLRPWRAIVPIGAEEGIKELFAASLRLRRNRIDLVSIPNTRCRAARAVRGAPFESPAGSVAIGAADASGLICALRFPGASGVFLSDTFDHSGWRDPSIPATLTARRGIEVFARPARSTVPGVTGVIHAPDSPRALFCLLRDYRPRQPAPLTGLAEAA